MPYENIHQSCYLGCKIHVAYIRIGKWWYKVGYYHTLCGKFVDIRDTPEVRAEAYQNRAKLERSLYQLYKTYGKR